MSRAEEAQEGAGMVWTLSGFGDEIEHDPREQAEPLGGEDGRHLALRGGRGKDVLE